MGGIVSEIDVEKDRIVLELLESVERDGSKSQRHLASELGIALGLVNAYLKRCVKKGLVKVGEAPARRYAYYLTPSGFAEKSRLTVSYLSHSFGFFRQAKADCDSVLRSAKSSGFDRLALVGCSDLAEIAMICARDVGTEISGIVDPAATIEIFAGVPVVRSFDALPGRPQAVMVTDLATTEKTMTVVVELFGPDRVFVPSMLRGCVPNRQETR